jgi:hypothetical protein
MGKKLFSGRKVGSGHADGSKSTQFIKGQSGHRQGRGKGVRNFMTEINEELNVRIPITENGTRKTITKRRAAAKQVVNKAVVGDLKAFPIVLNQERLNEEITAAGAAPETPFQPEDQLVMANIVKRIREADVAPAEFTETATDSPVNHSDPEVGGAP